MTIRLTPAYIFTFLLLVVVMMEMHEIVHITVGRIICGCWGPRDFNVWALCNGCKEEHTGWWAATAAGPFFSVCLMWLGMALLSATNIGSRAVGLSLIFSNIPFGRITTVMMGGGDEMVVVRNFMSRNFSSGEKITVGSIITLLVAAPPVVAAYRAIRNKRKWLIIVAFLTAPLLFILLYLLIGLNSLLRLGVLEQIAIMGTPLLITLHTALAVALLIPRWKNLSLLSESSISLPRAVHSA
jgi:hypothetical protein